MLKLPMGTHAVIEHCNLLIQKGGSLIEASCAEIPSQEAVRQAIKKRYQIAVTLSPWQRTAANGWVAIVTSELTTRK